MKTWYHINVEYAAYGIAAENGVVVDAAPIAKWMIGKKLKDLSAWFKSKNAIVTEIK